MRIRCLGKKQQLSVLISGLNLGKTYERDEKRAVRNNEVPVLSGCPLRGFDCILNK